MRANAPAAALWAPRVVLVMVLTVAVSFAAWRWASSRAAGPEPGLVLKEQPVLREVRLLPAGKPGLSDDAEVVGVVAGGRSRAYALEALRAIHRHVVNDRVGGMPVTVAYCDRTACAKVFTAPGRDRPLDVAVAGWDGRTEEGSLLLRVGPAVYRQDTGMPLNPDDAPFPYPKYDFVRTTWKEWRAAHPDSDVHVGTLPVEEYRRPGEPLHYPGGVLRGAKKGVGEF